MQYVRIYSVHIYYLNSNVSCLFPAKKMVGDPILSGIEITKGFDGKLEFTEMKSNEYSKILLFEDEAQTLRGLLHNILAINFF